jgi:ParB-like chromosome segregation protein Spo0J
MSKTVAKQTTWRNRIVDHTEEDPAQLLANPLNFRRHPGAQRDALRGSIGELGWIKAVLVNRTTGHVIDGHARCEEAITAGATVPVDWVEMSIEEERLALAVLDPISEMATRDDEALAALLADVSTQNEGLQTLLDDMASGPKPKEEKPADLLGVVIPCETHDEQMAAAERLAVLGFRCALGTIKRKKGETSDPAEIPTYEGMTIQ